MEPYLKHSWPLVYCDCQGYKTQWSNCQDRECPSWNEKRDEYRRQMTDVARDVARGFMYRTFGKRYADVSFENCEETEAMRIAREFKHGHLLALKGEPGRGKSFAARCIIRRYVEENYGYKGYKRPVYYSAVEFNRYFCRAVIPFDEQCEVERVWDELLDAKIVLIEGLESVNVQTNPRFLEKFFEAFDRLHDNQATLILTSNNDFGYDERFTSRAADWGWKGTSHFVKGPDLRKQAKEALC